VPTIRTNNANPPHQNAFREAAGLGKEVMTATLELNCFGLSRNNTDLELTP